MMKVCAISDLHGHLPEVSECDLLLLGGDLCPAYDHSIAFQAIWLDTAFHSWLERVPAKHVIGVAGNHDFIFEKAPGLVPKGLRWTYLQDSGTVIEGVRVWGSPHQCPFFDWAFNRTDEQRKAAWDLIPSDTEVLVLHGPPFGIGDQTPRGESVGCKLLRDRILGLTELKLAVWGHIHHARGVYQPGGVVMANVSHVNEQYRPVYPVMEFEL